MSNVTDFRPVEIAASDIEGLSDGDLVTFGLTFERGAAHLTAQGHPHAANVLMELSGALRCEFERRQAGSEAATVAQTALGDAGAGISRAEANRLMTLLDGLVPLGELADALFLLGLAAAVERQLASNLAAEARVLALLDDGAEEAAS